MVAEVCGRWHAAFTAVQAATATATARATAQVAPQQAVVGKTAA